MSPTRNTATQHSPCMEQSTPTSVTQTSVTTASAATLTDQIEHSHALIQTATITMGLCIELMIN